MRFLELGLEVLKGFVYCLVGMCLGYIIGDEIQQRHLRAELRNACYEESVRRLGQDPDKLQNLVIEYQCRNAIP